MFKPGRRLVVSDEMREHCSAMGKRSAYLRALARTTAPKTTRRRPRPLVAQITLEAALDELG